ncbi:coil containing protein [Vibrio phage 1.161.O._10N.261.48.C5]|nr:coil containing protein [Vibrio phage 1.161.O._10N.261.48.C5]
MFNIKGEGNTEDMVKSVGSKIASWGWKGLLIGGIFITGLSSFTTVDSGETVRIQNTMSGEYEWHMTEGMKFKVPFFSKVDVYNSVSTIAVTDDQEIRETSSAVRAPLAVTFADNYGGMLEASWRVRLSTSSEKLEQMHQEVKSQRNLEGNTFQTFAKDMLNLTTDQFLAQDFMQGGKGAFKQRLQDQADNGMLQTKREKVEILGQVADQSLGGDRNQASTAKQFAYRVVVQLDAKGNPLRRNHSLAKYGIEVTQVDLGEFTPNIDLSGYVTTIKNRERERADLIADQRKEREQAITAQLKGETARITAKNKALMSKDREVIEGQKQVELAQIQAEREIVEREKLATLSKIDKDKELLIAQSNEGIQKANEKAAKYEAQAILHKGLAQAKVKAADYKAIDKEILISNNNRDVAIAMYNSNMVIDMPEYVNVGGEAANQTSVENMSTIKFMEQMKVNTAK